MTPSNPSPDTGAGTPLTARNAASLLRWLTMQDQRLPIGRLISAINATLEAEDAARSRPATDPAGLDVERLAEAIWLVEAARPGSPRGFTWATFDDVARDQFRAEARVVATEYERLGRE